MKKYNLAPGDFPDIRDFQDKLSEMDFTKFHSLKQKLVDDIEGVLANDIPRLMAGKQMSSFCPLVLLSPSSFI
jgi:EH domain-containing protein 1